MKIVRENIEFKRGQDPQTSLGIGIFRKKPPIDEDSMMPLDFWDEYPFEEYVSRMQKFINADMVSKFINENNPIINVRKITAVLPGGNTRASAREVAMIEFLEGDVKSGIGGQIGYGHVLLAYSPDDNTSSFYNGITGEYYVDVNMEDPTHKSTFIGYVFGGHRRIQENLNFKRGQDPKKSINIGEKRVFYPPFKGFCKAGTYLVKDTVGMWFKIKIPINPLDTMRTHYWTSRELAKQATEYHTWEDLSQELDTYVSMQEL